MSGSVDPSQVFVCTGRSSVKVVNECVDGAFKSIMLELSCLKGTSSRGEMPACFLFSRNEFQSILQTAVVQVC